MTQKDSLSPSISLSLSSLHTSHFISLCFYPFSLSLFYISHSESPLSPYCPLFFHVSFSISLCTPTRSDADCYARRIAPYTLTLCCKSFIGNVEVFLREACIISEFGSSQCSCLGAGPVVQFLLLFCGSSFALKGYRERGRPQGGITEQTHKQSAGLEQREQAFVFKSALTIPALVWSVL